MARERLNDKLLRLTQENAALQAEVSALNAERKNWQSKENLLKMMFDDMLKLNRKYWQQNERAFRLETALRSYHNFAIRQLWWLNREHDLGLDMDLCHFGWDETTDREIINELFPQKEREEKEAEWEAQWQRLQGYKARCSSGSSGANLDDIWKSFKTVSNGSK